MIKSLIKLNTLILILSGILFFGGCDKKADSPEEKQTPQISADSTNPNVIPQPDTTTQAAEEETIDLTGKWSGTFDSRSATLTITKQNEDEFSGSLTAAYRNPLTKTVSGKFDKETMKFTMVDTEHSHFKGNYSGKLTDDGKMSGTFTMDSDNKNYSFSFKKK